jgi:lysozyme
MKTSQVGIDLIKSLESLQLTPYKCPGGFWTVGYGHLTNKVGSSISEEEANELLAKDLAQVERAVSRLIRTPLNQNQFDALSSFTFNLGSGALQASTLRAKINRGDFKDIPVELEKWVWAGGRKLKGLLRRRQAEAILFQQPYSTNIGESSLQLALPFGEV